jgi:hypothetical protein
VLVQLASLFRNVGYLCISILCKHQFVKVWYWIKLFFFLSKNIKLCEIGQFFILFWRFLHCVNNILFYFVVQFNSIRPLAKLESDDQKSENWAEELKLKFINVKSIIKSKIFKFTENNNFQSMLKKIVEITRSLDKSFCEKITIVFKSFSSS